MIGVMTQLPATTVMPAADQLMYHDDPLLACLGGDQAQMNPLAMGCLSASPAPHGCSPVGWSAFGHGDALVGCPAWDRFVPSGPPPADEWLSDLYNPCCPSFTSSPGAPHSF